MGYFSNIYKCARNDGGWGGWSALSGIDYVAESGKCVVYRVQVNYDAEDTALSALSIATNFVNPLSSDNPSSACCYLYDFDPTFGGSAAIASPPTGCIGTAGPIEFSASHVGSYLTFPFSAPSGTPQTLYFWFTSSVKSTAYGSNQIYHCATGNWNAALKTGTRAPAIFGGMTGNTGGAETGGGGEIIGVDSYVIRDYGATLNLTQQDYSTGMYTDRAETGRMQISFAYTASVNITASAGENSSLSHLYISDSPEIDSGSGRPVGILLDITANGESVSFAAERGKIYYFFSVYNGGITSGSVSISIEPPELIWGIGDSAEYNLLDGEITRSITLGAARYSVICLSFAHRGRARFYTEGSTINKYQYLECFLCEAENLDQTTGNAEEYLAHRSGNTETGDPPDFDFRYTVQAGKKYYLFTKNRFYSAGSPTACSTRLHIVPPAGLSGYTYTPIDAAHEVLGPLDYVESYTRNVIREQGFSFKYNGRATFAGTAGTSDGTPELHVYLCSSTGIDNTSGVPTGEILAVSEGSDFSFTYSVEAGREYYLYAVIGEIYYSLTAKIALSVSFAPYAAVPYIFTGKKLCRASAYLYAGGKWRRVTATENLIIKDGG